MIRIQNIPLPIGGGEAQLKRKAARILGIKPDAVVRLSLARQSIDARKKQDVHYVYTVDVSLKSGEEEIRRSAADSLFRFYFQKEQYEKAEGYLDFLSDQNPEWKRLKGTVYEKTGRTEEAWKAYEELLYSYYTMVSLVLRYLTEKQVQTAYLFDMGEYSAIAPELEQAVVEKDEKRCLEILEQLLNHVNGMDESFRNSLLYSHLKFKVVETKEKLDLREYLKKSMREDPTLDFLKETAGWKELMEK